MNIQTQKTKQNKTIQTNQPNNQPTNQPTKQSLTLSPSQLPKDTTPHLKLETNRRSRAGEQLLRGCGTGFSIIL